MLYFVNIRRFFQADIGRAYQNGISLLNLTATAFLMCAYTGRFIYPLLSLEGRKFWILGLLPLERDRLLWGKFAFASTGWLLIARVAGAAERPDAGHGVAGRGAARLDGRGAGAGAERPERGAGSVHAELPRNATRRKIAVGLRRHAEPAG